MNYIKFIFIIREISLSKWLKSKKVINWIDNKIDQRKKKYISLNSYNELPNINEKVNLLTHYNISEKGHDLFGFVDSAEKKIFEMLISVSGIGPKIAINMLSVVNPNDFRERLISGEVKKLTSLPGIGPKTAKRLIVELKEN